MRVLMLLLIFMTACSSDRSDLLRELADLRAKRDIVRGDIEILHREFRDLKSKYETVELEVELKHQTLHRLYNEIEEFDVGDSVDKLYVITVQFRQYTNVPMKGEYVRPIKTLSVSKYQYDRVEIGEHLFNNRIDEDHYWKLTVINKEII